jgi:hypothetical protein
MTPSLLPAVGARCSATTSYPAALLPPRGQGPATARPDGSATKSSRAELGGDQARSAPRSGGGDLRPGPVAATLRERHGAGSVRGQDAVAVQLGDPVRRLLPGLAAVAQASPTCS